jgi:hypothetical protein
MDAWVTGGWGSDEIIEWHPVHLGDGQEDLEVRSPLARLEPGQCTHGNARRCGYVAERQIALPPERAQPRSYRVEDGIQI